MTEPAEKLLTPVEGIKARSNFLRGTLEASLADAATGALAEDDTQLSKFHGFYQQDDRDQRSDRQRRKLEPDFSFMIRVRVPGGIATPGQWLALDALATSRANGTLRLTTRQAFQFHGVIKRDLKPTIRAINESLLDTIAACGDVNRNVMCTPLAELDDVHAAACETARRISERLTPRTRAYHEIWLDGERVVGTPQDGDDRDSAGGEEEPLYGRTYLPRKFKIAVAIPPANDVDVFAQDLGFIAIREHGRLAGFNVTVGGGMGMSHGEPGTWPRVADVLGFCSPERAVDVAEQVVAVQRDFGDRTDRKHARLKYTIADRGLDWFREELERRLGEPLARARDFAFTSRGDRFGWVEGADGRSHLTLYVPQGRLADNGRLRLLSGLRAIARHHDGDFRLTANQNLVISGVRPWSRLAIDARLAEYGIAALQRGSALRRHALACVALPTCSLAMAEAERYLPMFVERTEALLAAHGLAEEPISLRMTGCPNGCARPYLAEIGLVGKAPGRYSLFLGGDRLGRRLNRPVLDNAGEDEILHALDGWFARYAAGRSADESFGDFVDRHLPAAAETT